jgi:hypothetical protein
MLYSLTTFAKPYRTGDAHDLYYDESDILSMFKCQKNVYKMSFSSNLPQFLSLLAIITFDPPAAIRG